MKIKRVVVGPIETNCFIVMCQSTRLAIIIDAGGDAPKLIDAIESLGARPVMIVNTHGHADHIEANGDIKKRWPEAALAIHEADAPMLTSSMLNLSSFIGDPVISPPADRLLKEGDKLEAGSLSFIVIHTPGHTPGGICLVSRQSRNDSEGDDNKIVFSGDTLFANSVGRTDFPGGDAKLLLKSITEKILTLPDDCVVHPGHGPSTTIGQERNHNIFILSGGTIEDEEE